LCLKRRRRADLRERFGFDCQCERCGPLGDLPATPAAPPAAAVPSSSAQALPAHALPESAGRQDASAPPLNSTDASAAAPGLVETGAHAARAGAAGAEGMPQQGPTQQRGVAGTAGLPGCSQGLGQGPAQGRPAGGEDMSSTDPDWFLAAVRPSGWGLPPAGQTLTPSRPFGALSRVELAAGRPHCSGEDNGAGVGSGLQPTPADAEAALQRAVAAGAEALIGSGDAKRAWAVLESGLLQVRAWTSFITCNPQQFCTLFCGHTQECAATTLSDAVESMEFLHAVSFLSTSKVSPATQVDHSSRCTHHLLACSIMQFCPSDHL